MKNKYSTFLLILTLISLIFSKNTSDYTSSILYSIILGNTTSVSMILNTFTTSNTVFSNSNRPYAKELNGNRNKSSIVEDVIIKDKLIKNFNFSLKLDDTLLKNKEIQGELGLGIGHKGKNDFIEILSFNKIIKKNQLIIETDNFLKNNKIYFPSDLISDKFYYVTLTDKEDLEQKYKNSWVFELSHILFENHENEVFWNNTQDIIGRVTLDSRSKYIYIPENYIELLMDIWNLNMTLCPISEDKIRGEKFINCSNFDKNIYDKIKDLYFIIDGYGFMLSVEEMFEYSGEKNNYYSLIRFRNEVNDIWTLGIPFFKKYKVLLDYTGVAGFSGENVIDFRKEHNAWKKENEDILYAKHNDNKILIIGTVIGCIMLLTVLFCVIRSIRGENSRVKSKFIEEV